MIFCSPDPSGAYFEVRCQSSACPNKHKKFYLYIGTNLTFDFLEEKQKLICTHCNTQSLKVNSIGLLSSKYTFQGELEDFGPYSEFPHYSLGYQVCQNLKQKRWKWLQVTVQSLSVEEMQQLQKATNENLDFDQDINDLQLNSQNAARFNEKNKQNLKKEADRKRDIIYYLKKNLKDQQKVIKKLSKKVKNLQNDFAED